MTLYPSLGDFSVFSRLWRMIRIRIKVISVQRDVGLALFLATVYARERSQVESAMNPPAKRTASYVCLTLKDLPSIHADPSIATLSGSVVSHPSLFKTLPPRRTHRVPNRQPMKIKQPNALEIDKTTSTSPPILTVPNLMDLATHPTPLPILNSSMNYTEGTSMDSPSRYAYDTQVDSNGVHHHRLYPIMDNLLRSTSKIETLAYRTISPGTSIKMPAVHHGNSKKSSPQRTNFLVPQQHLSTIDSTLRERSIVIANENVHQPDAMERVNSILKQLYLPTDKSKRS